MCVKSVSQPMEKLVGMFAPKGAVAVQFGGEMEQCNARNCAPIAKKRCESL